MITRFFNKSKPIHLAMVLIVVSSVILMVNFYQLYENVTLKSLLFVFTLLILGLISIILVHYITNKNELTHNNSYVIVLYTIFTLSFTDGLQSIKFLLANIFILLAVRGIFNLRTKKSVISKIFDATLWISIAVLIEFWAMLIFILVYMCIAQFKLLNLRHFIVTLSAIATTGITLVSYSIIRYDSYWVGLDVYKGFSYNFTVYSSWRYLVPIIIFLSLGIWAMFGFLRIIKNEKRALKPILWIIVYYIVLTFIIAGLQTEKTTAEFIFMFAPLGIIMARYIESIQDKWFKELFFGILLLTPLLVFILRLL